MRSRVDTPLAALTAAGVIAVALIVAPGSAVCAQPQSFDDAAIEQATNVVKGDPQLRPERTLKTLRWKDRRQPTPADTPAWTTWVMGFFVWIGQSARYLVWAAAGILVVIVARYVAGIATARQLAQSDDELVAPTHVQDLDIRPESLPDDIGAAAGALWDSGQQRAALALLYRGLLSRLAHVHRLPIRDATTEGDCIALAQTHLRAERRDYATRLVRVWQLAVYGQQSVAGVAVHELCDGFAAAMNGAERSAHPAEAGRP